jgi:hypothetical protein
VLKVFRPSRDRAYGSPSCPEKFRSISLALLESQDTFIFLCSALQEAREAYLGKMERMLDCPYGHINSVPLKVFDSPYIIHARGVHSTRLSGLDSSDYGAWDSG